MKGASEQASSRSGGAEAGEVFLARTKPFTRRSRELPASLQHTWDEHASYYVIEVEHGLGYTTVAGSVHFDPEKLFGCQSPLTIEIGLGTGEQIVEAAHAHPDYDYLAFRAWASDIAKLISRTVGVGVENIRIVEADAQLTLPIVFGEVIAQEVWTFFPSPQRKARHHKRRLVSVDFAPEVARALEDRGLQRLMTDWDDYAWQMRDVVEGYELFENPYGSERPDPNDPKPLRDGFAPRLSGHVEVHFEIRRIGAGRRTRDLVAVRLPREGASSEDE